ncbi:prepilin-type N-terminal cleavage/methylation domain-containing protein [Patescibacteria group bacterium]|nr:prepilin-type N-terminal cleavage/methylation domain-containing protein [Patescibacteria group bacterium]
MRNKKGFTLIELLVVIAIIGLLSTLAVVSLNNARQKARDARRLSDVKQLSTIIEMAATEGTGINALEGCTTAGVNTNSCTGPHQVDQFDGFLDPSSPETGCGLDCTGGTGNTCQYSIAQEDGDAGATVEDYEICFYLESGSGSLGDGCHAITTGGLIGTCVKPIP